MTGLFGRRTALVALGFALLALLLYGLWPKPVGVDSTEIRLGAMRVTVDEEGKTRIKDVYAVTAPIAGKLRRTKLLPGDPVIAGETVVAMIDPVEPPLLDVRSQAELNAQIAAAHASVRLAEADLAEAMSARALARTELARARKLARSGVVAEKSLDRAETDAAMREAAVARAEAGLAIRSRELASIEARRTVSGSGGTSAEEAAVTIRAPASGVILKVLAESEGVVAMGAPLLEVGDRGSLEVIVDYLSMDAVRIQPGAEAVIEGWGGNASLPARVERIEPMGFTKVSALGIEEQRVRAVLALAGDRDRYTALGHDFRVVARVLVSHQRDVLLVPLGALFRQGDSWAVFKIADGRARLQPIVIGERNQTDAVVIQGLVTGDRVALHPSDRIGEGVRVNERTTE